MKFIILLLFIPGSIIAQIDYSEREVFTKGLNVPNEIVFDSSGNLFVANHSFASFSEPFENTIAKIDATGIDGFFEIAWGLVNGLEIPDPAGPISGPAEVCQGETGVQFTVEPIANATGYVWILPENEMYNSITESFTGNRSVVIDAVSLTSGIYLLKMKHHTGEKVIRVV